MRFVFTVKLTSSTAVNDPNRLVSPSTRMAGAMEVVVVMR